MTEILSTTPFEMSAGGVAIDREGILRLRQQYLVNGYVPLPSYGKAKPIIDWQRVEVTPELVRRWRRSQKLTTTCIRIEPPLTVFDIDVDDPIASGMRDLLFKIAGHGPRLVRRGAGFQLAIFVRCEEPFARLATRRWSRPGDNVETVEDGCYRVVAPDSTLGKGHQVEAYGGASARYFGAAGPHSFNPDGSVRVTYRWEGPSPEDTPVADLSAFSNRQAYEFLDRCEELMASMGWTAIAHEQVRKAGDQRRPGAKPHASPQDLAEALAVIPGAEDYEMWNKVGMAIFRATKGRPQGLTIWDAWSAKASNYGGTDEKWETYGRSPPTMLGAGSIFHLADLADSMWRRRLEEKLYKDTMDEYRAVVRRTSGRGGVDEQEKTSVRQH